MLLLFIMKIPSAISVDISTCNTLVGYLLFSLHFMKIEDKLLANDLCHLLAVAYAANLKRIPTLAIITVHE